MFYKAIVLANAALGLLGIGLAHLQRRHNLVYYWCMFGAGVVLLVPLAQYFFGRLTLLCGGGIYGGHQAVTLEATAYLSV